MRTRASFRPVMVCANGSSGAASVCQLSSRPSRRELVGEAVAQQHVVDAAVDAEAIEVDRRQPRLPVGVVLLHAREALRRLLERVAPAQRGAIGRVAIDQIAQLAGTGRRS